MGTGRIMREILFVLAVDTHTSIIRTTAMAVSMFTHRDLVVQALGDMVFSPDTGEQIQQEADDVTGEDESDDPLQYRSRIPVALVGHGAKHDGQPDLHQDEGEFDPEGDSQDALVAVVDPQSLVRGTDEDGGEDETGHEQ